MVLLDINSTDFQSQMHWGLIFSRTGVPDVDTDFLLLRNSSVSIGGCCTISGVLGETMFLHPTHLDVALLSFLVEEISASF